MRKPRPHKSCRNRSPKSPRNRCSPPRISYGARCGSASPTMHWHGLKIFARAQAKGRPNVTPPGALRVAEAASMLQLMRANTLDGLRRFARAQADSDELTSVSFAVAMNNIKVGASRLAGEIINHAMLVCGILDYKNDTPFSIGRHMRDVLSAPIKISNDRIFGNMSNLLLIHRLDPHLAS